MSLSKNDAEILQQIVNLDGKCIDSRRCKLCPFRVMCLPEFLYPNPPSPEQRLKMALDVMTHHELVGEEQPFQLEDHKWDKK